MRVIVTFALVDFCWIFFRADSLRGAIEAVISIFTTHNYWLLATGGIYSLGLAEKAMRILIYSIILLMLVDYLRVRGINVLEGIMSQHFLIRNLVYVTLVMAVLIFGKWGIGYDANMFIYFQF